MKLCAGSSLSSENDLLVLVLGAKWESSFHYAGQALGHYCLSRSILDSRSFWNMLVVTFLFGNIRCLFCWNKTSMIKQHGMADCAGQLTIASLSYHTRTVIVLFTYLFEQSQQLNSKRTTIGLHMVLHFISYWEKQHRKRNIVAYS